MAKYRKKPVVIEAVQWMPESKPEHCPGWLANLLGEYPEAFNPADGTLKIRTLEGEMTARPGDWIIKGIKDEVYPCKADIFAATYEPAEATP